MIQAFLPVLGVRKNRQECLCHCPASSSEATRAAKTSGSSARLGEPFRQLLNHFPSTALRSAGKPRVRPAFAAGQTIPRRGGRGRARHSAGSGTSTASSGIRGKFGWLRRPDGQRFALAGREFPPPVREDPEVGQTPPLNQAAPPPSSAPIAVPAPSEKRAWPMSRASAGGSSDGGRDGDELPPAEARIATTFGTCQIDARKDPDRFRPRADDGGGFSAVR